MMCKMEKTGRRAGIWLFVCLVLALVMLWPVFFVPSYLSYGAGFNSGELKEGESRVFDYAGLFSPEETQKLEEEAARLREKIKAEFLVLTVDKAGGWSSREIADEFYFSHGFGESFDENGALVLIDMDNREIYLGTYGIMIRVITDQRLERILDAAFSYAARGDYAGAALTMLGECEAYVQKGIVAGQYNYNEETGRIEVHHTIRWYEALVALAISAAAAGLVCSGALRGYRIKGDNGKDSRLAYQESSRLQLQPPSDRLVNTTVHHTVIARQSTGGHSSGGSSSRRSTTHSHHGHRAGGGGRKF